MSRKKKIRTEFRKDHQVRRRKNDLTRQFARDDHADDKLHRSERITGKGDLTRKRTIVGQEADPAGTGFGVLRDVAKSSLRGRVL
ncbi:MAG: ribosome small subunit-dependent GTPase A, partial [Planctomycetia bacterium]|nr:ribosome small subunit-dependent GTPase A [Planctomycetia bacterium]